MRIFFLADINSAHTIKWVNSLVERGHQIGLYSLNASDFNWYQGNQSIKVYQTVKRNADFFNASSFFKLGYLAHIRNIRNALKDFNPDILHAHYASSYGLLARLSGFSPFVISVWGADVFDFPTHSFLARKILTGNFSKADRVLSTSEIMKKEIQKYTEKQILVTPFGIDPEKFKPLEVNSFFEPGTIVLGSVKQLELKYGTDYLIQAFKKVLDRNPHRKLALLLVGSGTKAEAFKNLAEDLGIKDKVIFTGKVPVEKVPEYHNQIDIFLNISIFDSESFGVSVIEAMACEKPVIVSRVGGLPEVVIENETGLIVEPKNIEDTVVAIELFLHNPDLMKKYGKAGRAHVVSKYNWNQNLDHIEGIYRTLLPSV